jgi:hypothetical protein
MNDDLQHESGVNQRLDHVMNRLVAALLIAASAALMILQAYPPQ